MALPLLAMAGGLSTSLSAIYHVGKGYDNQRFWSDYYRNTGHRPRYPFRAGAFDYLNEYSKSIGVPYLYSRGMRGMKSRSKNYNRYRRWYR